METREEHDQRVIMNPAQILDRYWRALKNGLDESVVELDDI